MESNYSDISYKLCNETSMKDLGKDFLLNIPIDELYCIDMEDLKIGGSWNTDFLNYIRLDLYLCKDGINYTKNNNNCTSHDFLINKMGQNNNWYFELLYPSVQFQPSINKIPILVLYKTYYYGLNLESNKLDRIYLQENIIEDKQGWIFENHINKSYWGTSSIQGDNYAFKERDPVKYGSTSRLYSLNIYLDYGIIFYKRRYKKLIETLGEIFPILRVITTIFSFISEIINELKANKELNEYIMFNKKGLIQSNKNIEKKDKKIKILNISVFNNKKYMSEIINVEDSKISCINNNKIQLKNNKQYNKKNINKKLSNTINITKTNTNPFDLITKHRQKYSIKIYFLGFCLNKIQSTKKNKYLIISNKFNQIFTFYTRLIDITSYITLYKQFESLKNIIINNTKIKDLEKIKEEINKKYQLDDDLFENISIGRELRANTFEKMKLRKFQKGY